MAEPFYIIDNAKFEMVNSKYAMTTICNILMNLVVLENKVVEDAHIFYHLLKFIMNTLPSLENNGEVRYWVSLRPPAPSLSHIKLSAAGPCVVRKSGSVGSSHITETLQEAEVHGLFNIQIYPGQSRHHLPGSQMIMFRAGRGAVPVGRPQLRGGAGGGGAGGLHSIH